MQASIKKRGAIIGLNEKDLPTNQVSEELQNYGPTNIGDIRPMNVRARQSEVALLAKYFQVERKPVRAEHSHSEGLYYGNFSNNFWCF